MILSFGNKLTQDLVEENWSKEVRAFPAGLVRAARKKLAILHAARELKDLLSPPGNRLERLRIGKISCRRYGTMDKGNADAMAFRVSCTN